MGRLVCACVVRNPQRQVFSRRGPYDITNLLNLIIFSECPSPVNVSDSETETDEEEEEFFSPTVSPPKIYDISPAKFCITRGQPIEFRASFSAVPQGTVKWLLNKQEIFTDGRIKIDTSEHFSTLSIGAIEPGDSGKIDVIVENDIGIDTAVASLTVQGKTFLVSLV